RNYTTLPTRLGSRLQFLSNELPGVVIDEGILVYDSGTSYFVQDFLNADEVEVWHLVVLVIALTGRAAMLAVVLLIGTKNHKASSLSEHSKPLKKNCPSILEVFEQMRRVDVIEDAVVEPVELRGVTTELDLIAPGMSIRLWHIDTNRCLR